MRTAIYVYWFTALDMAPKEEWGGKDGLVAHILKEFNMPKGSTGVVFRVLTQAAAAHAKGFKYNPARCEGAGGCNKLITKGSVEEQIVADAMEEG